jgi:hypothetical protein
VHARLRALWCTQVRHWEGVQQLDGVDTLLAHLLADAGSAAELEAFAAAPNEARLDVLSAGLRARRQHHVLALLSANSGDAAGALALWKVRSARADIGIKPACFSVCCSRFYSTMHDIHWRDNHQPREHAGQQCMTSEIVPVSQICMKIMSALGAGHCGGNAGGGRGGRGRGGSHGRGQPC